MSPVPPGQRLLIRLMWPTRYLTLALGRTLSLGRTPWPDGTALARAAEPAAGAATTTATATPAAVLRANPRRRAGLISCMVVILPGRRSARAI
jgi:hypothetical protein